MICEEGEIVGNVHKLGDHINTDLIIPATYLVTSDAVELGGHLLEGLDPGFPKKVRKGDIILAGVNFGSGSSREHAALAIKGAGISCVIAASFARIFFRNAINTGLPIVECPEAYRSISDGTRISVNLEDGLVKNLETGEMYYAQPYPDFMRDIVSSGGLIEFVKKRLEIERD